MGETVKKSNAMAITAVISITIVLVVAVCGWVFIQQRQLAQKDRQLNQQKQQQQVEQKQQEAQQQIERDKLQQQKDQDSLKQLNCSLNHFQNC